MSEMSDAPLAGALAELYARVPRGMELGLEKMLAACTRFGHPERKFKAIHVAGTNGKGSVCAMVEAMARTCGRKTGLYTSPHLSKFSERIRIDGTPISDATLQRILSDVLERAPELSFFEAATMTAFVAFAEADVDLAIVEVGIGGRLDATNVIEKPLVTAITRIAFDHMDKLGNSLPLIAREKAGIVKPGVTLILGSEIRGEARVAIEEIARDREATVVAATPSEAHALSHVDLALRGDHQAQNADVAVAIARELAIDEPSILRGLRDVHWPGRLEELQTSEGPVLLDAAHNPDGAATLATFLKSENRPLALVFGALADKAWPEMIDVLAPLTAVRVYTTPKGRVPTPPSAIAARYPGEMALDPISALSRARRLIGPDGLVVVAGSIFLIAEIRAHVLGLPSDPAVAL